MKIERALPANKHYPYVTKIYSGDAEKFDSSKTAEIQELFCHGKENRSVTVMDKLVIIRCFSTPDLLSDFGYERLLKPFIKTKPFRYAQGYKFLNEGKGFTFEELTELVQNATISQTGIDCILGDEAASALIIGSLLDHKADLTD